MKIRCVTVAIAALVSGSVLAAPPADPSKAVSYADLNTKSTAGVETLYKRIAKAAYEVCRMPYGTRQFRLELEMRECKADAINRAVQQADLPKLTALHQAKTGHKGDSGQYAGR
jgi:UrcA family protein